MTTKHMILTDQHDGIYCIVIPEDKLQDWREWWDEAGWLQDKYRKWPDWVTCISDPGQIRFKGFEVVGIED